ncbi:MAG: arylsulfatase, partial [Roseibacillus sp.]|nr:arylsulfatase [Roseibacillus sp.]
MVSRQKPAIFPPSLSLPAMIRLIVCLCLSAFLESGTSAAETRPNIILIMADDMGYEALSANGSESCKSPHLDKLAAKGVRFTNCFSNPICTPSRVKIMTGQYNVRNYVKFGWLDREQTTFAHQL